MTTMTLLPADDPRHGTPRGYDAHLRNGGAATACGPCRNAAAAYEYRRRIDGILGRPRTTTSIGTRRRIQALVALGYTFGQIGREFNRSQDWAAKIAHRHSGTLRTSTAAKIDNLYRRWCMTLPEETTGRQRHAAAYARSVARRHGWPPPLAWNNIDDATEQPRDWEYVPADRAEHLTDLDHRRAGITEVCAELGIRRDSVERWCERNGLRAMYVRFMERETRIVEHRNQWSA